MSQDTTILLKEIKDIKKDVQKINGEVSNIKTEVSNIKADIPRVVKEIVGIELSFQLSKFKDELVGEWDSFRQQIHSEVDWLRKEVQINEQDRTANANTHEDHENRLVKLEGIHPDYQHLNP